MENLTKVCGKCKIEKTFDSFNCNTKMKSGLSSYCKICTKEKSARWYKENQERAKETSSVWYRVNKEIVRSQSSEWKKTNPENVKKHHSNYRLKHPEKIKAQGSKQIESLQDRYIRKKLKRGNLPEQLITDPEIIEIKRLTIKIHRLCKIQEI